MPLTELLVRQFFQYTKHSSIIHVVTEDHLISTLRGTVVLKKQASSHAPLSIIVAPQVMLRIGVITLQHRVVHTGSGYRKPALHIRVARAQGCKIQLAVLFCILTALYRFILRNRNAVLIFQVFRFFLR